MNLFLRFLLELCALAVYGYWGFKTGNTGITKGILGIGTPLVIAIIWGLFGSPKATIPLSAPLHLLLEIFVFLIPVVLLFLLGTVGSAWIFGCIVILNRILMYFWDQ
ncbi:YrdB family protein [Bacillus sp. FJAT-49754]|uniref:YrdB family protein n=1 Tax=Lederbergia citrea TaxID=2833581 RepID=A0A942UM23_9BACI|nr:YrdB family protein [Lederbergia citrea]MBS4221273.1 YrdB family protein [Lederbergia citrea]